jgi:hypothetical protein
MGALPDIPDDVPGLKAGAVTQGFVFAELERMREETIDTEGEIAPHSLQEWLLMFGFYPASHLAEGRSPIQAGNPDHEVGV